MTESTDAPTSRPHGRRARRLTPEEAAELEARAAQDAVEQTGPIPPLRGAVAAPEADAPVPKLRKFGRRARIVEIADAPDEVEVTGESPAVQDSAADAAQAPPAEADDGDAAGVWEVPSAPTAHDQPGEAGPASEPAEDEAGATAPVVEPSAADGLYEPATDVLTAVPDEDGPSPWATEQPVMAGSASAVKPDPASPVIAAATATAPRLPVRDADGVELGEMSVSTAPDPRPAPRFDGKVLHRPERTGSHRMLWLVWVLIALAVVVLVLLLVTGVIGGNAGAADAAARHILSAPMAGIAPDIAPWRGTPA